MFEVFGVERPKNIEKGLKLLEQSADTHYPHALETLAYIYENGIGVKRDSTKAKKILETLSKTYHTKYHDLAHAYITGYFGVVDLERAKFLLKLGAEKGESLCQKRLETSTTL